MNELELSAKIKQCRKAAKFLMGAEYAERIGQYKTIITNFCERYGVDNQLQAVAEICSDPKMVENTFGILYLFAAAAELIEPEKA